MYIHVYITIINIIIIIIIIITRLKVYVEQIHFSVARLGHPNKTHLLDSMCYLIFHPILSGDDGILISMYINKVYGISIHISYIHKIYNVMYGIYNHLYLYRILIKTYQDVISKYICRRGLTLVTIELALLLFTPIALGPPNQLPQDKRCVVPPDCWARCDWTAVHMYGFHGDQSRMPCIYMFNGEVPGKSQQIALCALAAGNPV